MNNVLIAISIRKNDELNWVKTIIERHYKDNVWLVADKKSTEILARSNLLSKVKGSNVVVFASKEPEELAFRIFKVTTPDIVYVCDKYNVLKVLVDLLETAFPKSIKC